MVFYCGRQEDMQRGYMMCVRLVILLLFLGSLRVLAKDVTTLDGKTYKDVELIRKTPLHVIIQHSTGAARIPFGNLPESWRKRWGYSPAQAYSYAMGLAHKNGMAAYRKRIQDWLRENEVRGTLHIEQLVDGGALCRFLPHGSVWSDSLRNSLEMHLVTRWHKGELLLVEGIGAGLWDGASWSGVVYPMGTYRYTTVLGAEKTVPRFTTSATEALRRNVDLFFPGFPY